MPVSALDSHEMRRYKDPIIIIIIIIIMIIKHYNWAKNWWISTKTFKN